MNLFHRDFMGAVRGVAFPAYAKAYREGRSVEASYIASVAVVTGIAWPFYGFAALFPLEILRIVFGPQWDSAAQLVPFFCLAGAFAAVVSLIPSAMMAIGQTNLIARADLIIQPVKAGLLTFLVMYHKALFPFAVGFLAISILAVPYFYAFKQKCLPTDFGLLGRSLARSASVAALSLAPASVMAWLLRDEHGALGVLAFLACLAVTGLSWVLSLWGLGHPLFGEGRRLYSRLTG